MKYWILAGIIVLGLSGCADSGGSGSDSDSDDATDGGTTTGDGTTGGDGTANDDPSTVIVTATLPPGDQCPNGGISVESGIDENGNGTLDAEEVDLVQIVCNGEDGTAGDDGVDGIDNAAIADIGCAAGLEGEPSIGWFYHATLLNSGDVIVTGSIFTALFEVSTTNYYSSQQVGATTGGVVFTYDLAAPANGGWWRLELDRSTLIVSIIYNDVDFVPNPMTWIQTPDKCIVNDFTAS